MYTSRKRGDIHRKVEACKLEERSGEKSEMAILFAFEKTIH